MGLVRCWGVLAAARASASVRQASSLVLTLGFSPSVVLVVLSGFVREELAANGKTQTYVPAVLTAKNADRLKHETAFHNPKNLNPDQLMNDILERYFKWLDEARA